MYLTQLFERRITKKRVRQFKIVEILKSNTDDVQKVCDLINAVSKRSMPITPARLKTSLGASGRIFMMVDGDDTVVGTCSLRERPMGDLVAGEVTNLYVAEGKARTVQNVIALYRVAATADHQFDFVYCLSNHRTRVMNQILQRVPDLRRVMKVKSDTASKIDFVWVFEKSKVDVEIAKAALKDHFNTRIIQAFEGVEYLEERIAEGKLTSNT